MLVELTLREADPIERYARLERELGGYLHTCSAHSQGSDFPSVVFTSSCREISRIRTLRSKSVIETDVRERVATSTDGSSRKLNVL
jgi:hypothetical protein